MPKQKRDIEELIARSRKLATSASINQGQGYPIYNTGVRSFKYEIRK